MQREIIAPDGNDERRAGVRVRGHHPFIGNPHRVDEVRLDAFDISTQALGRAADGQGAEPVSDGSTQAQGPRGGAARALRRFFNRAKGHGDDLKALDRKIQGALKRGSNMDFTPALRKVVDPVGGDRLTGIHHVEDFHGGEIIRHCPKR